MKKFLTALALFALIATPAMAKDLVPWTGTVIGGGDVRADIVLEYDGDLFVAYGASPGWTDYTCVNFEAPAGGPFSLDEFHFYGFGPDNMPVDVWEVADLFFPPISIITSGTFLPGSAAWPPGGWDVADISGLGVTMNTGALFGLGTDFAMFQYMSGIGLADAYGDGNPGHSWAIWSGMWTDDTYGYGYDSGIRAGLNGGGTPVEQTTWGGVKALYR